MDRLERLAGRLAHGVSRWTTGEPETHEDILETATLVSQLTDELALGRPRTAAGEAARTVPGMPEVRTALIVDVWPESRRALRSMLSGMGYTVLEAASGEDALQVSKNHSGPIHVMLTDLVMQEMSGRELAERLAALRPDMRVVYMSGYTDAEIMYRGMLGPGVATLQKPVTSEALTGLLAEVEETQYA
jgi:two-component system cell cycle sensor histidine kinase/response regulator CckA